MAEETDKRSKADQANELLAAIDTDNMDEAKAEQTLADPNAPTDKKALADEVLADVDEFGLHESSAVRRIAEQEQQDELGSL